MERGGVVMRDALISYFIIHTIFAIVIFLVTELFEDGISEPTTNGERIAKYSYYLLIYPVTIIIILIKIIGIIFKKIGLVDWWNKKL